MSTLTINSLQSLSRTPSLNETFNNSFFVSNDDSTENGSYSIEEEDVYPNNFLSTDLILSIDYVEALYIKETKMGKEKMKKGSKQFVIRKGDWKCKNCFNINYGFRKNCNHCSMPKEE